TRILCPHCKSTNSIHLRTCYICENVLIPTSTSPCSAYSDHASTSIQCAKCHTNNDSFAKFCSTCGCVIEPPLHIIDTRL
ncbi:unnamed protein product, partial [Rotaria sp. Silwood1]